MPGPKQEGAAKPKPEPELPPLDHPASPAEAARYIDLTTMPPMNGAEEARQSTAANLSYRVSAPVKEAYEFHQKQLLSHRWMELPESSVTDQYASGTFERAGFHVSLMVSPSGDAGKLDVTLHNHGNVDLAKLPLPAGTSKVYAGPLTAMYVTASPVDATKNECRNLVAAQGWEPYGSAGDTEYFRRNAVQLQVTVSSAPAQGGKTMITYLSEQMSADIPAPQNAEDLRYNDMRRKLTFDTAAPKESVADHYKAALAKTGWKPNQDGLFRNDDKDVMVFRNPDKDLIWLEIKGGTDGKSKVSLRYQTGAEIAAMDKKFTEQAETYKAKMKAELAKPTVELKSPPDAKIVSQSKNEIRLNVPPLRAKAIAEEWNTALHETGWLVKMGTSQGAVGTIELSREAQLLTIHYRDSADSTGEITVTSTGVGVEAR